MRAFLPFLSMVFILSTFTSTAAMANNRYNTYTVSCKMSLIGGAKGAKMDDQLTSDVKTAAAGPSVRFELGGYVLNAFAEDKIIKSAEGILDVPTLNVQVLKKNAESIAASHVNFATTPAIMEIGESRSISSLNFLKLEYKDQVFFRMDYTCQINRVQ